MKAIICISFLLFALGAFAQPDTEEQTLRSLVTIQSSFGQCNGVLINNEVGNPYVLTARHCFPFAIEGAIITVGGGVAFPTSNVNKASWETDNFQVVASSVDLDYTLLEILDVIPLRVVPFLAGWDARPNVPLSTYGYNIQNGEVIFNLDIDPPAYYTLEEIEAYGGSPVKDGTFWIKEWELGHTDLGSSGAPLFNQWSLIVGALSAGASTIDNPVNDFYSRLDLMFEDQLSGFLGSNNEYMQGSEVYDLTTQRNVRRDQAPQEVLAATNFSETFSLEGQRLEGILLPTVSVPFDPIQLEIMENGMLIYDETIPVEQFQSASENFLLLDQPLALSGEVEVKFTTFNFVELLFFEATNSTVSANNDETSGSFGVTLIVNENSFGHLMDDSIIAYPNPVRDNLWLEGHTDLSNIVVYDKGGKEVDIAMTIDYRNRTLLSFNGVTSGLFFVKLPSNQIFRVIVDN